MQPSGRPGAAAPRRAFVGLPSTRRRAPASENKLANGEPFLSFIWGPDPIK